MGNTIGEEMIFSTLLPAKLRRQLKLIVRNVIDVRNGSNKLFAKSFGTIANGIVGVTVNQKIMPTDLFENKHSNIKIAAQRLHNLQIKPGEIFSFWRAIGMPTAKNQFKIGRNIIAGKLSEDYGGGLCQISGIIYHAALLGGLTILERHSHSTDIYNDKTRFAPLGSDATLVYGYKDLRIQNSYKFPLEIRFHVNKDTIEIQLVSAKKLSTQEIQFELTENTKHKTVITKNGEGKILAKSIYQK